MIDRPQRAASAIGKTGCYFLSICYLSGDRDINPLDAYAKALGEGILAEDCTVLDAGKLLSRLSGMRWTCLKAGAGHELSLDYQLKAGEREILRYERPPLPGDTASTDRAHFVVGDGQCRIAWDPYGDSLTVKNGHLASRRIFRQI